MKKFLCITVGIVWSLLVGVAVGASSGLLQESNSAAGHGKHIKTSSLLTCMTDSQFQSSFFDVSFFPDTRMVKFHIDATTTISEKVVAKVELIAYGLTVLEKTIDFCNIGEALLCPLRAGRINVNSTYEIGNDIVKDIPNVAYTIPDLDAQVRVLVYGQDDTSFKNPLACVQAVLSNDKTVQTKYASWPIAAISGVGVLTSGFVSVVGHSTTAAHIASNSISLFVYFQNLAITSMMGVSRVPPIAAAWSQNFQWSMGIINVKFMQDIFQWYVQATGGTPVVVVSNREILSISVQKRRVKRAVMEGVRYLYGKVKDYQYIRYSPVNKASVSLATDINFDNTYEDREKYTTDERNSTNYVNKIMVLHGIQRVAFKAGIELSNIFLTGISFFLCFVVAVVFSLMVFKLLLELLARGRLLNKSSKFVEYRRSWGNIIKGTLFRIAIIAFPQVSILSIWEFTQTDSAATVVDAVVVLSVICGILLYGTCRVIMRGKESTRLYKTPAYLLYGDVNFLNRFGFLYVQFKADLYWWLIPLLSYSFLRSFFVAILQEYGKAQALIIFIIELSYFCALCVMRPYLDKRTNIFNVVIHLINLLNAIFFLFFSNLFRQPPIVSSVLAIVLFVLNAAFALFLLIFTIFTCVLALVHRNPDARYQPMKDDRVSFIPKIVSSGKSEKELDNLGKAVMVTNETEAERQLRDSAVLQNTSSGRRILFDELDDSPDRVSRSLEPERLEPTSTVSGPGSFGSGPGYHRIPTAPNTGSESRTAHNMRDQNYPLYDLRKPEDTLLNNDAAYHGYEQNNEYGHGKNPFTRDQQYM